MEWLLRAGFIWICEGWNEMGQGEVGEREWGDQEEGGSVRVR